MRTGCAWNTLCWNGLVSFRSSTGQKSLFPATHSVKLCQYLVRHGQGDIFPGVHRYEGTLVRRNFRVLLLACVAWRSSALTQRRKAEALWALQKRIYARLLRKCLFHFFRLTEICLITRMAGGATQDHEMQAHEYAVYFQKWKKFSSVGERPLI